MIPVANQPDDITNYSCQPYEVKLLTCIYDLSTGEFRGMKENLTYIVLRGDSEEVFLSYGFNLHKSKVLYAASKGKIPDAFIFTSFNKHSNEMLNERREKEGRSTLTFFLPSIAAGKEEINQ